MTYNNSYTTPPGIRHSVRRTCARSFQIIWNRDLYLYTTSTYTKTIKNWQLRQLVTCFNPLTPNDDYSGRTVPLTSKRCILYIYSTHTGTEYFKHGIYSPIFPLQNAVCFINLTYLVPVLFTFYIQGMLKLKKK